MSQTQDDRDRDRHGDSPRRACQADSECTQPGWPQRPPARSRSPSHESYYCVFKFRVRVSGKSTVALERFPGQITQAQLPG
jgi:hypothetical protein